MRPARGDILDNFTPEQAEFVAALIATMPGCKLTVRRSRRRPSRLVRDHLRWPYMWAPQRQAILEANANMLMSPFMPWSDDAGWNDWPTLSEGHWTSPAQCGRAWGRNEASLSALGLRTADEYLKRLYPHSPEGKFALLRQLVDDGFVPLHQPAAEIIHYELEPANPEKPR